MAALQDPAARAGGSSGSSSPSRRSGSKRRSHLSRHRKARRRSAPSTEALELVVGDLALPRACELAGLHSPFQVGAWAPEGPLARAADWLGALCNLRQTCRALREAAVLHPDRDRVDGLLLLRVLPCPGPGGARHALWALPRQLELIPEPRAAPPQLPGLAGALLAHLGAPLERFDPQLRSETKADLVRAASPATSASRVVPMRAQLQPLWARLKALWDREHLQGARAALHLLGLGLRAHAAALESMRNTLHPSAGSALCVRRCRGCERSFLSPKSSASQGASLLRALVQHAARARPDLARRRTFHYWAAGLLGSRPGALEPQRAGDDPLLGGADWLFCCAPCESRCCEAAWAPLLRAQLGPDALCDAYPAGSLGAEVEGALRRNDRARAALGALQPADEAQAMLCRAVSFALDLDAALLLVSESNRAVHRPCCVAAQLPGVAQNWRAHSVRSELWHEVALRLEAGRTPRFTRRGSAYRALSRALGCAVALLDGISGA